MTKVDIYTKHWCPCSGRAINLLESLGIEYNEINITEDSKSADEMRKRSGRLTVPQVFFGHVHIGGSDELYVADKSGLLGKILCDDAS